MKTPEYKVPPHFSNVWNKKNNKVEIKKFKIIILKIKPTPNNRMPRQAFRPKCINFGYLVLACSKVELRELNTCK